MLKFFLLLFVKDTIYGKTAKFHYRLKLKIIKLTSLFTFHTASLHSASKLAPFNGSSGTCSIVYRLYVIPPEPFSKNLCFMGKQADSEDQLRSYVSHQ